MEGDRVPGGSWKSGGARGDPGRGQRPRRGNRPQRRWTLRLRRGRRCHLTGRPAASSSAACPSPVSMVTASGRSLRPRPLYGRSHSRAPSKEGASTGANPSEPELRQRCPKFSPNPICLEKTYSPPPRSTLLPIGFATPVKDCLLFTY